MGNAYDHDDPRNWERDEDRHPACGGTSDECRCGPTAQPEPMSFEEALARSEAFLKTLPPEALDFVRSPLGAEFKRPIVYLGGRQ